MRTCQLIAMKPRFHVASSSGRTTSCTWNAPGMFLPSFRQLQTRPQNSVKHPLRFLHALRPIYGDSTCIRLFLEDKFVFHVHWLIYLGCCTKKIINSWELVTSWHSSTNMICSRDMRPPTLEIGFWNSFLFANSRLRVPRNILTFCVSHLPLIYFNLAHPILVRARHGSGTVGSHMSLTPTQWRKRHPCRCPSTWMSHPAWSLRHCNRGLQYKLQAMNEKAPRKDQESELYNNQNNFHEEFGARRKSRSRKSQIAANFSKKAKVRSCQDQRRSQLWYMLIQLQTNFRWFNTVQNICVDM